MFFSRLVKKQNESIHLVIPTTDIIKFRQSIGKKVRELLALTKYNYAELKLTVIADLVSFNKKRDREVSGIKRRDMILQRSLACERAKTADNELVKLTKLLKNSQKSTHASDSWEGRKSCPSAGATGHTQTY